MNTNQNKISLKEVQQELESSGWKLEDEEVGEILNDLSRKKPSTVQHAAIAISETALSLDLKKKGLPSIPKDIHTAKEFQIAGPVVLQVVSIVDISQPSTKQRSSNNSTLLVKLTDGHTTCSGVEMTKLPRLSVDTPPGTKVRIRNACGKNGKLLLTEAVCEVLGGRVHKLFDKWQAGKELSQVKRRAQVADGEEPPPSFAAFSSNSQRSQSAARKRSEATHPKQQTGKLEEKSSHRDINQDRKSERANQQKRENKSTAARKEQQKSNQAKEQFQKGSAGLPNPPLNAPDPPKQPLRTIKPVSQKRQPSSGSREKGKKHPSAQKSAATDASRPQNLHPNNKKTAAKNEGLQNPNKGPTAPKAASAPETKKKHQLNAQQAEWRPKSHAFAAPTATQPAFAAPNNAAVEPSYNAQESSSDQGLALAMTHFSALTIGGPMRCLCTVSRVSIEAHAGLGGQLRLTFLLQDKDGAKIRAAVQEDMAGYLLGFDRSIDLHVYLANSEGAAYIHGMLGALNSQFEGLSAAFDMKFNGNIPIIDNIMAYDNIIARNEENTEQASYLSSQGESRTTGNQRGKQLPPRFNQKQLTKKTVPNINNGLQPDGQSTGKRLQTGRPGGRGGYHEIVDQKITHDVDSNQYGMKTDRQRGNNTSSDRHSHGSRGRGREGRGRNRGRGGRNNRGRGRRGRR